jgi:hypothetical protein
MSTANGTLTVRGINVDVVRKDIRHLHIGVYPPSAECAWPHRRVWMTIRSVWQLSSV